MQNNYKKNTTHIYSKDSLENERVLTQDVLCVSPALISSQFVEPESFRIILGHSDSSPIA